MGEAPNVLVVVLVLLALGALVAMGAGFASVMAATLIRWCRPDPFAVDLDRVLEDILGQSSEREPMARSPADGLQVSDGPRLRLRWGRVHRATEWPCPAR